MDDDNSRLRTQNSRLRIGIFVALMLLCHDVARAALAKFEPARGCYVGAFIENDKNLRGDYGKFEELTGKKHASYFTYVGYGQPFPSDWASRVKAHGAAPHIALEPNDGLNAVTDDAYLKQWAADAQAARCPIFLRFASEMNGDWMAYHGNVRKYIEKFRLVHDVMKRDAPNVAMVWTPFAIPQNNIKHYYPGDRYVDWVGVNIYSVYYHDGDLAQPAHDEDPVDFLRYIYERYADRKPIQVSEFAATHFCKALGRDTTDFAVKKMRRFYRAVAEDFPRVKMINWFNYDTIGDKVRNNNYCLTDNPRVLAEYRQLVSSDHFIGEVSLNGEIPGMTDALQDQMMVSEGDVPVRPAATQMVLPPSSSRPLASARTSRLGSRDVALTGVEDGNSVSGMLTLSVIASPIVIPQFVSFQVDGRTISMTNIEPYRVFLNTSRYRAGEHKLSVVVRDYAGNDHASEAIGVTFQR